MKDYQVTAIIAAAAGMLTLLWCVVGYFADTYSMAATALLAAIGFAFVAAMLAAESVMDWRSERRLERWSAGK